MTHNKWIKLTPEEQLIKVAELCGWTLIGSDNVVPWHTDIAGLPPNGNGNARISIPDYLNDLNAIHKAEASLADDRKLWNRYEDELVKICCRDDRKPIFMCGEVYHFHATAAQRAEAFVMAKTMESK